MTEEINAKLEKLAELQKQLYAFRYATSSIYLDGATVAPKDTEEGRGEALGILTGYMYDLSTKAETIERKWYVLDAAGKPMGKTAVAAANILRGKHRPCGHDPKPDK